MIRNDEVRKEINEIIIEVFGEANMGFHEPELTNHDPFESDDDVESHCSSEEEETNVTVLPGMSEYMTNSESEGSISPPPYESLSDIGDDM